MRQMVRESEGEREGGREGGRRKKCVFFFFFFHFFACSLVWELNKSKKVLFVCVLFVACVARARS